METIGAVGRKVFGGTRYLQREKRLRVMGAGVSVMVGVLLVAGVLAVWFAVDEKFGEATVTLLLAACFLLVGIADLLGELIMLARQRTNPQRV